ncbi:alpha/beta hydrolase [Lactobacillus hamsteri]|nr:alpha/beta hydrolase [Lactobacillus hamsteri]
MSMFKTSDMVNINYNLQGSGKPIVLIAGFGGYQEIWTDQVNYLLKMGYQVLTYDHRNMGKSERTEKGHTLQRLTDDLIELLHYLNINSAVFIGHSMGGSILYDLYKTKPELIKLSIVVDQSPYMLNTADWPYGFMNYTPENYLPETLRTPQVRETLHGIDGEVLNNLSKVKTDYPFSRKENMDLLQEHSRLDWRDTVKNISTKLIVIAASQSPYYNSDFARWMAENNSNIESVVLENCGHDIMAEIPDRFNQLLRHFLLKNRYLPK